jgi:hypothetical protein
MWHCIVEDRTAFRYCCEVQDCVLKCHTSGIIYHQSANIPLHCLSHIHTTMPYFVFLDGLYTCNLSQPLQANIPSSRTSLWGCNTIENLSPSFSSIGLIVYKLSALKWRNYKILSNGSEPMFWYCCWSPCLKLWMFCERAWWSTNHLASIQVSLNKYSRKLFVINTFPKDITSLFWILASGLCLPQIVDQVNSSLQMFQVWPHLQFWRFRPFTVTWFTGIKSSSESSLNNTIIQLPLNIILLADIRHYKIQADTIKLHAYWNNKE